MTDINHNFMCHAIHLNLKIFGSVTLISRLNLLPKDLVLNVFEGYYNEYFPK